MHGGAFTLLTDPLGRVSATVNRQESSHETIAHLRNLEVYFIQGQLSPQQLAPGEDSSIYQPQKHLIPPGATRYAQAIRFESPLPPCLPLG